MNLEPVEHDYVKSDVQKRYPDTYYREPLIMKILTHKNPVLRAVDNVMAVVVIVLLLGCLIAFCGLVVYAVVHMTAQNWIILGAVVAGIAMARGIRRLGEYLDEI